MNSYERFIARLRGEPVDRIPNFDILMTRAARHFGTPLSRYYLDYHVLVEANLAAAADFHVDILQAISDPYREAADFGLEVNFPEDNLPLSYKPLIAEPEDLRKLIPPDPSTGRRMSDRLEAIRLFREKAGGEIPIMGWVEGALAEASDLRSMYLTVIDLVSHIAAQPQNPLQPQHAGTILLTGHIPSGAKPQAQRFMRVLENSVRRDGNRVQARCALVLLTPDLPPHPMPTPRTPESIGPAQSLKIRTAAFICAKAFGEFQLIPVHAGDWKLAYYHSQSRLELFNWANDLSETQPDRDGEGEGARARRRSGWLAAPNEGPNAGGPEELCDYRLAFVVNHEEFPGMNCPCLHRVAHWRLTAMRDLAKLRLEGYESSG